MPLARKARANILKATPGFPNGAGNGRMLADVVLACDAALLLDPDFEPELSGASCVVVRVEGLVDGAESIRRDWLPPQATEQRPRHQHLTVAHLGDCRALLGRRECAAPGEPLQWRTVRLTDDHGPGDPAEAVRLVSSAGSVRRCLPGKQAQQASPSTCLGPPRLWHRWKN